MNKEQSDIIKLQDLEVTCVVKTTGQHIVESTVIEAKVTYPAGVTGTVTLTFPGNVRRSIQGYEELMKEYLITDKKG